jgi:hypothetical protein
MDGNKRREKECLSLGRKEENGYSLNYFFHHYLKTDKKEED